MTRRKKLYLNTVTSFLNQIVTLICGFILPKYILLYFGSDVNGLVTSITRFLSVIVFLELGIGPVIQSNLYKPLAQKDHDTISRIVVSAEKFYRKIACIFLIYIAVLVFVYPSINQEFGFGFTASLLMIISISTFAQYYFGITYQVFLNADQKAYVQTSVKLVTTVLNTALCIVLILMGSGIHMVKLASAIVYVLRPLVQNLYVKRNYHLNLKITYTEEPIKQKWNGFAQHLASVVCGEIDVVLLTFLASYQSVSIYSVYLLVVSGLQQLVITMVSGLESFWGNMIARDERTLLLKTFESVECTIHMAITALFVSSAILIAPFVTVYTKELEDSGLYYVPAFGVMLCIAYGLFCLRIPYARVVHAAGHYKETQNGAIISMVLNIIISVALVIKFQLIGVAFGTVVAMGYHTIYYAWYLRKSILQRPFYHMIGHLLVDMMVGVASFALTGTFVLQEVTYLSWVILAIKTTAVVCAISSVNLIIYRHEFMFLAKKLLKKV